MNISDVNASTRSDQLKNASIGAIDPAASGRAVSREESEPKSDRVEISNDARAALSQARSSEELAFARKALQGLPEMSEERTAELQNRIKSGYYGSPDVLRNVSERIAAALERR